jgi:hypothetical protein
VVKLYLQLIKLQRSGKAPVAASEFFIGFRINIGEKLG